MTDIPLIESEDRRRGRLFRLRLKRNYEARQDALASVRQLPLRMGWSARIGGRMRGKTIVAPSRKAAEDIVNRHYTEAVYDWHVAWCEKRETDR